LRRMVKPQTALGGGGMSVQGADEVCRLLV